MIRVGLIFLVLVSSALATTSDWSCNFEIKVNLYKCLLVNEPIDVFEEHHSEGKSNDDVNHVLALRYVPRDLFKLLPNVGIFELKYFQTEKFSEGQFDEKGLKLQAFLANVNKIREIGENAFAFGPNLKFIDMRISSIEIVNKDAFRGLTKLESLYLGSNFIRKLDGSIFQNWSNLKTLNLADNQLTTLEENMFKSNQKLRYVTLSDNQLENIPAQIILDLPENCLIVFKRSGCIDDSLIVPADFDSNHPFIESIIRNCSSTKTNV